MNIRQPAMVVSRGTGMPSRDAYHQDGFTITITDTAFNPRRKPSAPMNALRPLRGVSRSLQRVFHHEWEVRSDLTPPSSFQAL